MAKPPTRYCTGCRHIRYGFLWINADNPRCDAVIEENIVTGKRERQFCSNARAPGERCGPHAALYESQI